MVSQDGRGRHSVLEGAILYPPATGTDYGAGESNFVSGVSDSSFQSESYFSHMRGGRPLLNQSLRQKIYGDSLSRSDVKNIAGNWFYGGLYIAHFGHFLSECIHRFWLYVENEFDGVIFLCRNEDVETLPDYVLGALEYLSISTKKIIFINEISIVQRLTVCEPGSQLNLGQADWYKHYLRGNYERNHFSIESFGFRPKKIWLSRKKFLASGRVLGLEYFENLIQENGFTIVCTEEYSFREQISLLVSAEEIVWEEGSSIHLLDMLPQINAKCFYLCRRPHYMGLYNILSDKSVEKFCYIEVECMDDFCMEGGQKYNSIAVLKKPDDLALKLNSFFDCSIKFSRQEFLGFEYSDLLLYLSCVVKEKVFLNKLSLFFNVLNRVRF